jgi:spermidine synthase
MDDRASPGVSDRTLAAAIGAAVFISGGVLLGIEIVSSRVLAPFFGDSLYVWGAVIGVVLAGLALGYALGGVVADRQPVPALLIGAIMLGAGAVLLIPVVSERVLEWVVRWDPGPRLDPVAAMVILFGPASVLLATVTPIAVRLSAREVGGLGRMTGRLFSISTCGSIAGCFVTAFWLVPDVGVKQLLAYMAVALFVAAAIVALAQRLWVPVGVAAAAAVGSVAAALALAPHVGGTLSGVAAQNWSPIFRAHSKESGAPAAYDGKVVFEKDTEYHHLAVVDSNGIRQLRFDSSFQSAMNLAHPNQTVYPYTDYMQLGLAYDPAARHVLEIGLGGGTIVKELLHDYPPLKLHVVELDPVVVQVARRYFDVPPDGPRLQTTVEDGRRYLAGSKKKWDVIMLDAFYADSIPYDMATLEFLELARSRLAQDGVIVTNMIGIPAGPGSELFRSLVRTYKDVFPSVVVHEVILPGVDYPDSPHNLVLIASRDRAPSEQALIARWARERKDYPNAPDLTQAIKNRLTAPISPAGVPILTDDFAPTDALIAENY